MLHFIYIIHIYSIHLRMMSFLHPTPKAPTFATAPHNRALAGLRRLRSGALSPPVCCARRPFKSNGTQIEICSKSGWWFEPIRKILVNWDD